MSNVLCSTECCSLFSQLKECIWTNYHSLLVCNLSQFSVTQTSLFSVGIVNSVILEVSRNMIKCCFEVRFHATKENEQNEELLLSDDDQEILMYIAGYIIRSVSKYCNRHTHNTRCKKMKEMMTKFVSNDKDNVTFVSKYKCWIEKLNRGGLTTPTDDFYLLVRHFELIVRSHISTNMSSSNIILHTVCQQLITANVNVQYYWNKLVPASSEISEYLLEKIIKLFLTLRGNSYARQIKSSSTKKPVKKEKSLRKNLKQKSLP